LVRQRENAFRKSFKTVVLKTWVAEYDAPRANQGRPMTERGMPPEDLDAPSIRVLDRYISTIPAPIIE
jgi:hypothetical protein